MAPAPRRTAPAPAAAPARRGSTRPSAAPEPIKSSYRGAAAMRQMQEEQVKNEAQKAAREASYGAPQRYWTPIGATQQIVVVDEMPDFTRHEHALQNRKTKKWDNYVPCIDEHANCPACAVSERPAYFALYLTIISLTGYENKDGDWVEFSKKLLVVKPSQQKKIMRLYETHKSLRGMILNMTRDTDKDATIGNDIEFVEFMDEEELLTYETEYIDKDNKVHPIIAHEVFDYESFMPDMTDKQLRALVGGRPDAGSREANSGALDDNWSEPAARGGARTATRRGAAPQEEAAPEPAPRRGARSAPAAAPAPARRRAADVEQEDEQQEEEAAAPAPARRAARGAPAPAPVEEVDENTDPDTGLPWEDEAPPEEAPPPRRAAPRGRTAPAAQDDAPQRPAAASVASRRASLRR